MRLSVNKGTREARLSRVVTPLGRSSDQPKHLPMSFAIAQRRIAFRSVLNVLRQSFVAGRTTSRSPTTSRKLPMGWTTRLTGPR